MRSIITFLRQDRRNRDARRDAPSAREASTVISSHQREQPPEERIRQPFSSRLWVYPDGRALDPCPTPFYSTKAVRRFSTPSPLPPGITLGSASDRPPRGGGNAAAHIAGQEFAIRVCAARLRLRSRLSLSNGPVLLWRSCQVRFRAGCPTAGETEKHRWQSPFVTQNVPESTLIGLRELEVCAMQIAMRVIGSMWRQHVLIGHDTCVYIRYLRGTVQP